MIKNTCKEESQKKVIIAISDKVNFRNISAKVVYEIHFEIVFSEHREIMELCELWDKYSEKTTYEN
jgi:hypothetical protein